MATYSVIAHDGKMYGPADEMSLSQWAREGRIAAHTMLHCHESGARLAAGTLPSLGPVFGLSQQQVNQLLNPMGQPQGPVAAAQAVGPQYAQPGIANYQQPTVGQPYAPQQPYAAQPQMQQPLQY